MDLHSKQQDDASDLLRRSQQGPRGGRQRRSRALFMSGSLLMFLCMCLLQGCASSRQATFWAAARSLALPNEAMDAMPLRPDLRYLRVSVMGQSKAMLMVLGYVDQDDH